MANSLQIQAGDKVLVGKTLITIDADFAQRLRPGDVVLGVAATGSLRRIPVEVSDLVDSGVTRAAGAFQQLAAVPTSDVNVFFDSAANLLADDSIFSVIQTANEEDLADAKARNRSTTRLVLSEEMRSDMVAAFRMWRDLEIASSQPVSSVQHDGWSVSEFTAPLGVIGFVFEGRPNVFADATGVLKSGNTVVFRIGSDALRTAKSIMEHVVEPALSAAGLPDGSVVLLESAEHAAGWALFSDTRLALAVARGSGEAVAELGSIAQQSGIAVSLHGTGGAWIIAGENCNSEKLSAFVQHSLDRKVCNTVNVVCVPVARAAELCPSVLEGAVKASQKRGTLPRVHCVNGVEKLLPPSKEVVVKRASGDSREEQLTTSQESELGHEFEWEETPEFFLVVVDDLNHAIRLFNTYSPQFVLSAVSEDVEEVNKVWRDSNAPFFGNGFTRWVDGQFALLRPELGLSNWQNGRLFARSGILSGDSAFSVRLRVDQTKTDLHR